MRLARLPNVMSVVAVALALASSSCSSARAPAVEARPAMIATVTEAPAPPPPVRAVGGDVRPYLLAAPEESVRLARAMARAIAVVRHDGRELVVLDECSAPGSYGFMGQAPKAARVSVRGADEIQSNFPWRAAAFTKEARIAKGLDPLVVDTLVLGSRATTRPVVTSKDLTGACAGATHFIRSATVGSHALLPSGEAWPPDACGYAKPESLEAPAACAAIVSVHLVPIGERDPFREGVLLTVPRPACPEGLVRRDLACVLPGDRSDGPFQCAESDAGACEHQCEKGHPGSCARHAMRLYQDRKSDRAAVVRLYEQACSKGEGSACTNLAWMKLAGDGTAKNEAAAAQLFATTCDGGQPRACSNLAAMYGFSWEGHTDLPKAFELDDRACRGGDPAACANLGVYYEHGRVVSRWHAKALEAYLRACDGGSAAGCTNAGDILTSHDSELPHEDARAGELFNLACEHDDGDACAAIGRLQLEGRRPVVSPDQPLAMFTHACELRSAEGCADLGEMYAKKGYARRDPVRARAAFEEGCERGSGRACEGAGALSAAGEGGPKDEAGARNLRERALRAYDKGCAAAFEQSCWGIANAARFGLGVTKDPERAARLFSSQCRDDKQRACASLAEMLAKGEAGTKDVERAKALAAKACERGFAPACPKK
jgi:TPR repeat protein